jgi:hypothetical protein
VEDIDKAAYTSSRYAQEEYSLNLSGFFNEENLRIEKWANSGRGDQGMVYSESLQSFCTTPETRQRGKSQRKKSHCSDPYLSSIWCRKILVA